MRGHVPNLPLEGAEVVFVLESPHVDEVLYRYPLAGLAGRKMAWNIFDWDVPFGLIARDQAVLVPLLKLPCRKRFSVMNVSKDPLQARAYTANGFSEPADMDLRESLRRNGLRRHRDDALRRFSANVYADFESACASLGRGTVIVPCGRFAESFSSGLSRNRPDLDVAFSVPHPATRRVWDDVTKKCVRGLL